MSLVGGNASDKGGGVPGRVFITQPIPEPGPSLLRQGAETVTVNPDDRILSRDELCATAAGCDAVICLRLLDHGRRASPTLEELGARAVGLGELLAESDFVSLHVPLTAETTHLIDARALAQMRPTAYLINTARGPVVDEAALVEAIRARRIAGVGTTSGSLLA